LQHNLESELALRYINTSIGLKGSHHQHLDQGRLLASQRDYEHNHRSQPQGHQAGEKQDITNFKTQLPIARRPHRMAGKAGH
jgi:hypothetical protein